MVGVTPSRLLEAMLSRAVASRTENCCSPRCPGGIECPPPLPIPPNAARAPPNDAAAATPMLAPMNWRRLSFLLIPRSPSCPRGAASWIRGRRDLVAAVRAKVRRRG